MGHYSKALHQNWILIQKASETDSQPLWPCLIFLYALQLPVPCNSWQRRYFPLYWESRLGKSAVCPPDPETTSLWQCIVGLILWNYPLFTSRQPRQSRLKLPFWEHCLTYNIIIFRKFLVCPPVPNTNSLYEQNEPALSGIGQESTSRQGIQKTAVIIQKKQENIQCAVTVAWNAKFVPRFQIALC